MQCQRDEARSLLAIKSTRTLFGIVFPGSRCEENIWIALCYLLTRRLRITMAAWNGRLTNVSQRQTPCEMRDRSVDREPLRPTRLW